MDVIIEGRIINTADLDFLAKIPLIRHDFVIMKRLFYVDKSRSAFYMFIDIPPWLPLGEPAWVSVSREYAAGCISGRNSDSFPGNFALVKKLGLLRNSR